MYTIGQLLLLAIDIYTFIIIAQVVISWLVAFGVLNLANPQATRLMDALDKATDPVMKPIRRFIPPLGGIDITPIIVIFGLMLLQRVVAIIFF
ncbi:MAG: YggT family protein [Alphaproteobacteria bacterium]|nr:YggT family protein [Alphaproteobacteria bacterium]